jgi:HlyD family secretion protein
VRRPGVWVLIAILLAVAVIAVVRARGPVVVTTTVTRTDLEQHLVVSGRVRVVTRVELAAEVPGRVLTVRAVEGRPVRRGDVLVELDDAEARAAMRQAQAGVTQAAGRVERLREVGAVVATESVREAATNLTRAESELRRLEALAAAGAVAATDVEEARRQVDVARARRRAAEAEQAGAGPEGAEARVAAAALVESQAALSAARARLARMRLLAPDDGIVLHRRIEPGDTVQPGQTLIEFAAEGETELAIEPDERHLASIAPGQIARASADAFPDVVFEAAVSYIAPAIDRDRGTVEVRLRVPNPPAFLRPDMTVSVDLTTAAKRGVLTVPSEAVGAASTDTPFVFVVDDGRVARRSVELGLRGESSTEIASGLAEGAEIIRVPPPGLADGQRVRASPERR